MMILDAEQAEHVARMASESTHAALMAGDTGVGKTLMSIELLKRLKVDTTLIIAPLNTLKGWRDTATEQGVRLPFRQITSKTPEVWTDLKNHVPGIYFIGREFFALSGYTQEPKVKKVKGQIVRDSEGKPVYTKGRKALWSWKRVGPGLTIYDEVQAVNNRYSQGYECLKEITGGYRLACSATPQGNRFEGLWTVCRWLWPKAHNPAIPFDPEAPYRSLYVDNSKARWAQRWCAMEKDLYTYSGTKIVGEQNPGAFVNSLPCYIRMEAVRTPVIVRKCYVDLTPQQRVLYNEMESDSLTWLDDNPLVAEVPIVQRIRLRQITLGEVTFNEAGEVDFADDCASSKIDALHKVVDKHHPGQPVLIAVDSAKFARVVVKRLGPLAREWSGAVNAKTREEIKADFGKGVRYIVAVIPAMAEGVDGLQRVCNVEVWLSESTNGMLNIQFEGRLNRRGQTADAIYQYKIMASDTDDDDGFERRMRERRANHASLKKEA